MPRILDDEHVVPALAAMVACAEVGDGPTAEQLALVDALAAGYFRVPARHGDLPVLTPDEVAAAFTTEAERRRLRHLLVLVEQCRHPLTDEQVERTEAYVVALGDDPLGLPVARDLVAGGVEAARADYLRTLMVLEPELREPSLAGAPGSAPVMGDPELLARLRGLADCPEGSLGRAYLAFYERWGFDLPGTDGQPAAMFVAHDMSHVISGYDPVGVGEIALGCMQLAIADTDEHWVQLLGNLGVHEAGYLKAEATPAVLTRPGALDTVAEAFDRGARCTADFTLVDHLALVDEPLEAVRSRFGIPPLAG